MPVRVIGRVLGRDAFSLAVDDPLMALVVGADVPDWLF